MKTRLALLLPLLALASCANNNASVFVASICLPPDDASTCKFGSTCTAQYIGTNALDVASTNLVWLFLEVHNQAPDNTNLQTGKTNTNNAFVQEYEVEFDGVPLPTATGPIPGSAEVPAAGTAVISVPVIDSTTGNALAAVVTAPGAAVELLAKLRLKGVFGDTSKFETGVFQVPVTVCRGCIGAYPACATAGNIRSYCPGNPGQYPLSSSCSAPQ